MNTLNSDTAHTVFKIRRHAHARAKTRAEVTQSEARRAAKKLRFFDRLHRVWIESTSTIIVDKGESQLDIT